MCLEKYQRKNLSLHFKEHCTKIDNISLSFSFYLVFKFNVALIGILEDFHHPEVYAVLLHFLQGQVKY